MGQVQGPITGPFNPVPWTHLTQVTKGGLATGPAYIGLDSMDELAKLGPTML